MTGVPAVTIRRAIREDLSSIIALIAEDDLGRGRDDASLPLDPVYLRAFDILDADPNQLQAVLEVDGKVSGTMQLTFITGLSRMGATRCQIEGVRVASALRGQGMGRSMFEWAISEAKSRGCSLAQLTSDKTRTKAHKFYSSLGFEASHEGYKLLLQAA
jgi:GNAT superfamily N-acetyltransferase